MNKEMPLQIVIITGLSGAGKSTAIHFFEDSGFFCMDNVPPALLPKFVQICRESNGSVSKIAVVADARGGSFFESLFDAIDSIKKLGALVKILYLDASEEVLIRRFSETRRKHPLNRGGRILDDIQKERMMLEDIKSKSDFVINTSAMNGRELQEAIRKVIEENSIMRTMSVVFLSFGFKHGVPLDCDLVFDVRFLPNPYYVSELKHLSGLNSEVFDYVIGSENGKSVAIKMKEFIEFLIPKFILEPKTRLQIGIGCTGGRHRSVSFAEYLFKEIQHDRIITSRKHRDLQLS